VNLSERLLDKTKKAISNVEELNFATLFGSLATRGETRRDIEVAVKASEKTSTPSSAGLLKAYRCC